MRPPQFTFNAENKQREVRDASTNQLIGQYFYDGDGKRIKKITNTGEMTVFVCNAAGKQSGMTTLVANVQN